MNSSVISDYTENFDLFPCPFCKRTFNYDSLPKHQNICFKFKIGEKRRLREIKNKEIYESQKPKDGLLSISEIIERKNQRRKNWRKDHLRFTNNLLMNKKCSDSLGNDEIIESSFGDSDVMRNLENFKLSTQNSNSVIHPMERNNSFIQVDIESDFSNDKYPNETKKQSLERTRSVPNIIEDKNTNASTKPPLKINYEKYHYLNNLFDNYQTNLKRIQSTTSLKIPLLLNERNRTKSNIELNRSDCHLRNNVPKNVGKPLRKLDEKNNAIHIIDSMKQYQNDMQGDAKYYLNQMSKVMDYYNKHVWNDQKSQQISNDSYDIPVHISAQRRRLELLKRRNKEMKQQNDINKEIDGRTNLEEKSPQISNDSYDADNDNNLIKCKSFCCTKSKETNDNINSKQHYELFKSEPKTNYINNIKSELSDNNPQRLRSQTVQNNSKSFYRNTDQEIIESNKSNLQKYLRSNLNDNVDPRSNYELNNVQTHSAISNYNQELNLNNLQKDNQQLNYDPSELKNNNLQKCSGSCCNKPIEYDGSRSMICTGICCKKLIENFDSRLNYNSTEPIRNISQNCNGPCCLRSSENIDLRLNYNQTDSIKNHPENCCTKSKVHERKNFYEQHIRNNQYYMDKSHELESRYDRFKQHMEPIETNSNDLPNCHNSNRLKCEAENKSCIQLNTHCTPDNMSHSCISRYNKSEEHDDKSLRHTHSTTEIPNVKNKHSVKFDIPDKYSSSENLHKPNTKQPNNSCSCCYNNPDTNNISKQTDAPKTSAKFDTTDPYPIDSEPCYKNSKLYSTAWKESEDSYGKYHINNTKLNSILKNFHSAKSETDYGSANELSKFNKNSHRTNSLQKLYTDNGTNNDFSQRPECAKKNHIDKTQINDTCKSESQIIFNGCKDEAYKKAWNWVTDH